MSGRTLCLAAVLLTLTGCKDILQKLAKKRDAGTTSVATDTDDGPQQPATSTAELEKAFAALDVNDDEQLDGAEVKRCGCAIADANGDGEITKAEYLAAGLLGKLGPGAAPTSTPRVARTAAPTAKPTTTPAQPTNTPSTPAQPTASPAAPVTGAGLPPGNYDCYGLVGRSLVAHGTLRILDAQRYDHGDASGGGSYVFDPATKSIRFTSGEFANPNSVTSARQVSPKHIQMRTGKGGFYEWDCER